MEKLFDGVNFYIQSNRFGGGRGTCSGKCWFCYVHGTPMAARRQKSSPMVLAEAAAIVDKAIAMGFKDIQLNGEDTLDDMESFWALTDACKDKPITFTFFTNGFALLRNPAQAEAFFRQVRERLGKVNAVHLTFSWDPEKVAHLKTEPQFNGDEAAVYRAMATVLHAYKQVFPETSGFSGLALDRLQYQSNVSIDAHDLGTGSEHAADIILKRFHRTLGEALRTLGYKDPHSVYIYYDNGVQMIQYQNPEAVREGIRRGRITHQYTINALFRRMEQRRRVTCKYSPFLDMSMGEITTCIRRQEYPRRKITPDNFYEALMAPYSNPRSRNLYLGDGDNRELAAVRQLGFALALDPSLAKEMQVSFEEVEAHLFSNNALMTKIEALFLLDDLVRMDGASRDMPGVIKRIPRELVSFLLSDEIIKAYSVYCAEYAPATERYSLRKKFVSDPETARKALRTFLEQHHLVADTDGLPVPVAFSKAAEAKRAALPTLDEAGFDPIGWLKAGFGSTDPMARQRALDIAGALISGQLNLPHGKDNSWDAVGKFLSAGLAPENLSEEEQLMVIGMIAEGFGYGGHVPAQLRKSGVIDSIVCALAQRSLSDQVRQQAVTFFVGDEYSPKGKIPETVSRRLFTAKESLLKGVNDLSKLKLMRDWYALGLMDLSEVAQGVAAMPDLPQADGFFTEVKAWGRDSVIFADILATAMRTSRDYHFSQAVETLAASAKGLQIVADFVAGVDYREFGEYYLDALAVLLSSNKYKELAQRLLNALPLSFFEQEDVFVHVCHSGLYAKLLRYYQPAAREIAIMGQELDNLSPGSMITSALERYKKRKAALQSVDTTKRETGGVDWRVQNFKVKIDTNENNISTAMDNIARSYAGLTFALTDMEKVTPAELSISF